LDSDAVRIRAEECGVTYLAGRHCCADDSGRAHMRLAYSYLPEDQITEATRRLVTAIRQALG
jgi:DNA-binding transcriptional MocR family regulator